MKEDTICSHMQIRNGFHVMMEGRDMKMVLGTIAKIPFSGMAEAFVLSEGDVKLMIGNNIGILKFIMLTTEVLPGSMKVMEVTGNITEKEKIEILADFVTEGQEATTNQDRYFAMTPHKPAMKRRYFKLYFVRIIPSLNDSP